MNQTSNLDKDEGKNIHNSYRLGSPLSSVCFCG